MRQINTRSVEAGRVVPLPLLAPMAVSAQLLPHLLLGLAGVGLSAAAAAAGAVSAGCCGAAAAGGDASDAAAGAAGAAADTAGANGPAILARLNGLGSLKTSCAPAACSALMRGVSGRFESSGSSSSE